MDSNAIHYDITDLIETLNNLSIIDKAIVLGYVKSLQIWRLLNPKDEVKSEGVFISHPPTAPG